MKQAGAGAGAARAAAARARPGLGAALLLACAALRGAPALFARARLAGPAVRGAAPPAAARAAAARRAAVGAAAEVGEAPPEPPVTLELGRETYEWLFRVDKRPVVLYDTNCWFCTQAMSMAMVKGGDSTQLRFQAMKSLSGRRLLVYCGREPDDFSTLVVLSEDGTWITDTEAALFLAERLEDPLLKKAAGGLQYIPQPLLQMAYQTISKNRHRLSGQFDPDAEMISVSDLKWEALSAEQRGSIVEAWARFDTEQAGVVDAGSLSALQEALGIELDDQEIREAFPGVDAGGGGTVSYESFRSVAARLLLAKPAS